MPARKMTFTFPEEVAASLLQAVDSSGRSKFVVDAVEARLVERKKRLVEACIVANNDPETQEIVREMASLANTMQDEQLVAACEALNADLQIWELEQDMDSFSGDGLNERPWSQPAPR